MRIWVDMDNAPHVLVMAPIIRRLRELGHEVEITARDYGQTLPLLRLRGLEHRVIGRHSGANKLGKYIAFAMRSLRLLFFAAPRRFDAVVCHGTRGVYIPARVLSLPLIVLFDYEFASMPRFMVRWVTRYLLPDVIDTTGLGERGLDVRKFVGYPGLKEDLYIHELRPDPGFLQDLGIDTRKVVVLLRPPATMAHYYVKESGVVFTQMLEFLSSRPDVEVILLPRTDDQKRDIQEHLARLGSTNIHIPDRAYDGPSLIWYSDLVISGGGTMNREAATLNVPVYTIYQGPLGAVDRHLMETGRLKPLDSVDKIRALPLRKSSPEGRSLSPASQQRVLGFVVDNILAAAAGRDPVTGP